MELQRVRSEGLTRMHECLAIFGWYVTILLAVVELLAQQPEALRLHQIPLVIALEYETGFVGRPC